jgi:hypothetical protein
MRPNARPEPRATALRLRRGRRQRRRKGCGEAAPPPTLNPTLSCWLANGPGIELPAAREGTKERPDGRPRNHPGAGRPAGWSAWHTSGWRPVSSNALLGRGPPPNRPPAAEARELERELFPPRPAWSLEARPLPLPRDPRRRALEAKGSGATAAVPPRTWARPQAPPRAGLGCSILPLQTAFRRAEVRAAGLHGVTCTLATGVPKAGSKCEAAKALKTVRTSGRCPR